MNPGPNHCPTSYPTKFEYSRLKFVITGREAKIAKRAAPNL